MNLVQVQVVPPCEQHQPSRQPDRQPHFVSLWPDTAQAFKPSLARLGLPHLPARHGSTFQHPTSGARLDRRLALPVAPRCLYTISPMARSYRCLDAVPRSRPATVHCVPLDLSLHHPRREEPLHARHRCAGPVPGRPVSRESMVWCRVCQVPAGRLTHTKPAMLPHPRHLVHADASRRMDVSKPGMILRRFTTRALGYSNPPPPWQTHAHHGHRSAPDLIPRRF